MLNIYYANLHLYNEGKDFGAWINLPEDEDVIRKIMDKISRNGEHECFIQDYETDCEELLVGEFDSVMDLNNLAELIEDRGSDEVSAAIYFLGKTATIEELDRCIENMYCVPFDYTSEEESVGRWFVDEMNSIEIPYEIEDYFDFYRYGRDLLIEYSHWYSNDTIYLKDY